LISSERLANLWLTGIKIIIQGGPLEELNSLLGPLAALQQLESSQRLREMYDQGKLFYDFAETARWLDDEHKPKVCEGLELLGAHLVWLLSKVEQAEEELKEQGWQFDPATRTAKTIPQANRPEQFINRVIKLVFVYLNEQFSVSNSKETRERIRKYLTPFFPAEMLGSERHGSISRAIESHLEQIR